MGSRRIIWLLVWLGSLVFLWLYRQWLAWLLLGGVLIVPLFSLLVSLPSMLTARLEVEIPQRLTVGTPGTLQLCCRCPLPPPSWSCRIVAEHALTGKRTRLHPGDALPTHRCGVLRLRVVRPRVHDFLGLFSLPIRCQRTHRVVVEPVPVPIPHTEEADADTVFSWKPKNGGFSENHELRLYVPGDSLRQIHWKLSAKTGTLILREPMIPDPGRVLIQPELKGSLEQLERCLGRVLWLGQRLLEQQIPFELFCVTGEGILHLPVNTARELDIAMDRLLDSSPAHSDSLPYPESPVTRQYCIGGEPDES